MPAGRVGASALLKKVNSQLRGERVPIVTKEEDELAVYLSGLQQKAQQIQSANFEEHGDISISSGKDQDRRSASSTVPAVTSKFLKKKHPSASKPEDDELDDHYDKNIVFAGRQKYEAPSSKPGSSFALEKTHGLSKKVNDVPFRRQLTRDSDTESELGRRPTSADTSVGRDGRKFLKGRNIVNDDNAKPKTRSPSPQIVDTYKKKKDRRSSKARGEIVRTLGNVYLSSEEESLAEFIHGLSASESSFKRPQNLVAKKQQKWRKSRSHQSPSPVRGSRSPSPFKRSPSPMGKMARSLSQESDLLDSMATEVVDGKGRAGSVSSEDNFNINLMDIASLIPASPSSPQHGEKSSSKILDEGRSKKKDPFKASTSNLIEIGPKETKSKQRSKKKSVHKSESKASLFDNLGIHMVDELLGMDGMQNNEMDQTDQSEILTEPLEGQKRSARRKDESESEIITELGGGDSRKVPVWKAASIDKSVSISERIGSQRRPDSPIESESYDETDTETSIAYSEDTFESESRRSSGSEFISRTSHDRRKTSKASHSQASQQSRVVLEQRRTQLTTTDASGNPHHYRALQTGVSVQGPYGLQYVDPSPVATCVVNADALEAITSYSPSVLALQDMMRAQLDLVRNFAELQTRIYQSCITGIKEDYHYTTLKDTKKYIEENRKPKMTFKEALKLVEQEDLAT